MRRVNPPPPFKMFFLIQHVQNQQERTFIPAAWPHPVKANREVCRADWKHSLHGDNILHNPSLWACLAEAWEWGMSIYRTACGIVRLGQANHYISILESGGYKRCQLGAHNPTWEHTTINPQLGRAQHISWSCCCIVDNALNINFPFYNLPFIHRFQK